MRKQYHILNGDALRIQFPASIKGEIIVARECLVDGDVAGNTLEELFTTRAKFLGEQYGVSEKDYHEKTASEFHKIQLIENESDINLWFEDDLFCQVNFWFTIHFLLKQDIDSRIFLVRPKTHNRFGFAGLSEPELIAIYDNRLELKDLNKISDLWVAYQNNDLEDLKQTAQELGEQYPFILKAAEAHMQRNPANRNMDRPTQSLIAIMEELNTKDFGTIFREFNKRESIYGFGDLQVKRLYDQIVNGSC